MVGGCSRRGGGSPDALRGGPGLPGAGPRCGLGEELELPGVRQVGRKRRGGRGLHGAVQDSGREGFEREGPAEDDEAGLDSLDPPWGRAG